MLEKEFERLYLWFRANYYKSVVDTIGAREGSLSATEQFCVEIIYLLGRPTVTEFAQFLSISVPNANYKINSLVKKGYVVRTQSPRDGREQLLEVTDKFLDYYGLNNQKMSKFLQRIRDNFTPEEVTQLEETIRRINNLSEDEEEMRRVRMMEEEAT